jgi:DNA-binding NtrC family response regulator
VPEQILLVTAISEAENCAAVVSKQFNLAVQTAANRKDALAALRRRSYAVVVLDSSLLEASAADADTLFRHSGLAIPLEINFATSGCGRLVREIRAALSRRHLEQAVATRAAVTSLETNLRDTVAGLLLQSQLALAEPSVPPQLADKLKLVAELAGNLRQQLNRSGISA